MRVMVGPIAIVSLILNAQNLTRVSGRVIREDTGAALSKVIVTLYPQDEQTVAAAGGERVVQTGSDGKFVISDLAPGVYALGVERNGFISTEFLQCSLKAGQDMNNVELRMAPAAVISGTVLDADDEPAEGLDVTALPIAYHPGGMRTGQETIPVTTDDRGEFRIPRLRAGDYVLRTGGMIQHPRSTSGPQPLKRSSERTLQYGETYYPEDVLS